MIENAQATFEAMKERLTYNRGDVLTINAIADLACDMGEQHKRIEELRKAAAMALLIKNAQDKISKLEQEKRKAIEQLEEAVMIARGNCPHPVTKYYPDASGNNDSITICLCCSAYV